MSSKTKSPKINSKNKKIVQETPKLNVYQIISESRCQDFLQIEDSSELEKLLIDQLNIQDASTNIKGSLLVDFFCTVIMWFRQNFEQCPRKLAAVFTTIFYLIENVMEKNKDMIENMTCLKSAIISCDGEQLKNYEGILSELTEIELAIFIQFIQQGLFQHYRLLEYIAKFPRDQSVLEVDLTLDTLSQSDFPFPPPLGEAVEWEIYNRATEENEEDVGSGGSTMRIDDDMDGTISKDIGLNNLQNEMDGLNFDKLTIEDVRKVLQEECTEVFNSSNNNIHKKVEELENVIIRRLNKSKSS